MSVFKRKETQARFPMRISQGNNLETKIFAIIFAQPTETVL